MYIRENVSEARIAFSSAQRPLDTAKEEVTRLGWLKRGTVLDAYQLVTSMNVTIITFASIGDVPYLIFHMPDRIAALSGNEWTHVQVEQLKVVFQDFTDVETIFDVVGVSTLETSDRGVELLSVLDKVDDALFRKYTPSQEVDDERNSFSETAIRADKMLQHPICKALFASREFATTESFVDDFVKHLLHEMGFNAGMLYVAPQMRMKLRFGTVEKMAIADFTIIDLLMSYTKIAVITDKNWTEMLNRTDSTPQLLAEAIAVAQRNNKASVGVKRDSMGSSKSSNAADLNTVYGITVSGSVFRFYRIQVSDGH